MLGDPCQQLQSSLMRLDLEYLQTPSSTSLYKRNSSVHFSPVFKSLFIAVFKSLFIGQMRGLVIIHRLQFAK